MSNGRMDVLLDVGCLCVFPHGSDRRAVLMRFHRCERWARLMVLEAEILTVRWKGLKHVEGAEKVKKAAKSRKSG